MSIDWITALDRNRLGRREPDSGDTARTAFQRDFDRIVFSSAFRRLQDKTQVWPLSGNDYVRTRLTHSLESSCVGRTLGTWVGEQVVARHALADIDPADFGAIVAAACLAHDIGNPPFGHAGEDAIAHWFRTAARGQALLESLPEVAQREDLLRFEGNAQGFRILTRLQSPDNPGGLQLTHATLGAFTKYPRGALGGGAAALEGASGRKFGFFTDDAEAFVEVAGALSLLERSEGAWFRHPLAFLVEAADDICYRVIDLEDAYRQGILGYQEVADRLAAVIGEDVSGRLAPIQGDKERVEYLRARAINTVIRQATDVFLDHEAEILGGHFDQPLLQVIPGAEAVQGLLALAEEKIYVAARVVEIEAAGFQVLGGMLETFSAALEEHAAGEPSPWARMVLHLVPDQFIGPGRTPDASCYRRLLKLTDFLSGMTDSYAVSLYKKLTGISLPGG